MSWLPSADPILGDKRSCDALELVVVPRVRDLGDGFEVRRALPSDQRQMVGPFIFFDQMGPAQFLAGHGLDVRPHIGLAIVTYLFDGQVMHRDSEGNAVEITPGAINLMTAGRGIAHSERTPSKARRGGDRLSGIQSWIGLPEEKEEIDPSFQHFDAAELPVVAAEGLWARVLAGSVLGERSRVGMFSEWFYAEVVLESGKTAPLDPDYEERAIYVVESEITIAGESFGAPRLLIFRPGDCITVRANKRARLMFLGGSGLEGPRYIWWNFVSSRRERIEQAKEDWKTGRFASVPDETEFIPLPEN